MHIDVGRIGFLGRAQQRFGAQVRMSRATAASTMKAMMRMSARLEASYAAAG